MPEITPNPSLALETYLVRHPEREPDKQDLALLFGEDLNLTVSDMSRYAGKSPEAIRDRFLHPDSEFVRNLSVILASPLSESEKWRGVKFFLQNDVLPPNIASGPTTVRETAAATSPTPPRALSPDNPIFELLDLEKTIRSDLNVATLDYLTQVLNAVAPRISDATPPRQCLEIAWQAMFSTAIDGQPPKFDDPPSQLLSECLAARVIDCDMTLFVLLALAHEMKWPLKPVIATSHVFSHWEGAGYFNNGGYFPTLEALGVNDRFSTPLDPAETRGLFLGNVGLYHVQKAETSPRESQYELDQAASFLKRGVSACPQHFGMKFNLGIVAIRQKRFEDARKSFKDALAVNPDYVEAWGGLAEAAYHLGEFSACRDDLKKTIALCDRLEQTGNSPYTPEDLRGLREHARGNLIALERILSAAN